MATHDPISFLRVVPADERVQRYERAVIMAVCSIRAAFNTLSQAFILEKKKVWEDLLGDKKLWKLARHQNPGVREGGGGEGGRMGEGRTREERGGEGEGEGREGEGEERGGCERGGKEGRGGVGERREGRRGEREGHILTPPPFSTS